MANIKSQIKRNRQNEGRRVRNKSVRSELKTRARTTITAAEAGDGDAARSALRESQRRTDMAVSKGIIHRNTAARRKSRLAKQVRRLLD